jgi:hypothetical protein
MDFFIISSFRLGLTKLVGEKLLPSPAENEHPSVAMPCHRQGDLDKKRQLVCDEGAGWFWVGLINYLFSMAGENFRTGESFLTEPAGMKTR